MTDSPTRIALLADLSEPVTPEACAETAAFAFELADALREVSGDVGSFQVDLFARRGSWKGLPLVSLDPSELGAANGPLSAFAAQEALYAQVFAAGLLHGYDLVHALAPVVTPLQLLAASGTPVVQTVRVSPDHPAAAFPGRILPPALLRRTRVAPRPSRAADGTESVPPTVDVTRFRPAEGAPEGYLLWLGSGGDEGRAAASAVASSLRAPLRTADDGALADLIPRARVLLHPAAPDAHPEWTSPLRALACGRPVAAWAGCGLDGVLEGSGIGALATAGDVDALAGAITALESSGADGSARRRLVLALYSRRPVVGRYRDLYAEVIEGARVDA